jgi:hypothetical protein
VLPLRNRRRSSGVLVIAHHGHLLKEGFLFQVHLFTTNAQAHQTVFLLSSIIRRFFNGALIATWLEIVSRLLHGLQLRGIVGLNHVTREELVVYTDSTTATTDRLVLVQDLMSQVAILGLEVLRLINTSTG